MVAEPVNITADGKSQTIKAQSAKTDDKTNALTTVQKDNAVAEPIKVGSLPRPNGELSTSQAMRVYSTEGKSVNITSGGGGMGAKTRLYAVPLEYNLLKGCVIDVSENRVSQRRTGKNDFAVQGKTITFPCAPKAPTLTAGHASREKILSQVSATKIYNVVNKMILINDKWYPCKLDDGYYEVRTLTVGSAKGYRQCPTGMSFPCQKRKRTKCWATDGLLM